MHTNRYRKIVIIIILLIIITTIIYFFNNDFYTPIGESEKISVRLGWVHQAQFAGFYVAEEKGFYDEVGLEVEFLELDQDKNQIIEVANQEVDFSVMEAHQVLVGAGDGLDIQAIMAVFQINPHVLAVRQDSDIFGPEDFSGKIIGLSGGEGEGKALFQVFVEQFSDPESVTYKNLGFDTINDFIKKEADIIDIYRIDQPFLAQKKGIPLRIIPLDAYGFTTYGDVIVTNKSLLSERSELARRFIQATQKGWEYALTNQAEAVHLTLSYTSGNYTDSDYQKHIIQQATPLIRGTQTDLGRMEFVSWSTLYETILSAGAIKTPFNVAEIYTNEYIQ